MGRGYGRLIRPGGATTADTLTKLPKREIRSLRHPPSNLPRKWCSQTGRICPYDNQVADIGGADPIDVRDVPNEMWHPLDWG